MEFVLQNTLKCIIFHVIWMLFTYANNAQIIWCTALSSSIMQCVTVIIQLVSQDHICRFENGSQMAEQQDPRQNRAAMERNTTLRGQDGHEWIEKWLVKRPTQGLMIENKIRQQRNAEMRRPRAGEANPPQSAHTALWRWKATATP